MLRYRSITSPDINNGLGCRITLWVSGCNHQCPGCHNPEMWDYNKGDALFSKVVIDKLVDELNNKPYIQGITLSGGDPLAQSDDNLRNLSIFITNLKKIVNRPFDIWVYSGDVYENLIMNKAVQEVLDKCDVLVDGPYMQDLRDISLPFRGSKNQRIIDLNETRTWNKIIQVDIDAKNS